MKNHIIKLKESIKVIAENQKAVKPQRKTVHFVGNRTFEPYVAVVQHASNRYKLRRMYLLYGLLRGKPFEVTESNGTIPESMAKEVNAQYEKLKEEAVRISA